MNPHYCRVLMSRFGTVDTSPVTLGSTTTVMIASKSDIGAITKTTLRENKKNFQSALRWALYSVMKADNERERTEWLKCLFVDIPEWPLQLSICYDNYINLLLMAASVKSSLSFPTDNGYLTKFMQREVNNLPSKCLNHFIGQSVSLNEEGDEWKWIALCQLIPIAKLSFSTQHYIIQQAVRRLVTVIATWDVNDIGSTQTKGNRETVNQAVFCISKLYEVISKEILLVL